MSKEKDALRESIKPEDIVFDNKPAAPATPVDDKDMPRPETKQYNEYLKLTPLFMTLFHKCVDSLPYRSVLTAEIEKKVQKIPLINLVRFVEQNANKMPVKEMNHILAYIADLDFGHARPLMEVAEDKNLQPQLWSAFVD